MVESSNNIPVIMALGKTGVGKSRILNEIAGIADLFPVSPGMHSMTNEAILKKVKLFDREVKLLDTMGFCDNKEKIEEKIFKELQGFLLLLAQGFNIVLIVLNVAEPRYDKAVFKKIMHLVGAENFQNCFIVLNQGEELKNPLPRYQTIKDELPPIILKEFNKKLCDDQILIFESDKAEEFKKQMIRAALKLKKVAPNKALLIQQILQTHFTADQRSKQQGYEALIIAAFASRDAEIRTMIEERLEESLQKLENMKVNAAKNPNSKEFKDLLIQYQKAYDKQSTPYTSILKLLLQFGAEIASRVPSKIALKAAKATPWVGLILGIGFGGYRFVKGQWVLGCIELASGGVSMIPGCGTLLSLSISTGLGLYEAGVVINNQMGR